MRRARPIPLCSFTWRSATLPSHPLQLECLMMIPSKIASPSHVGSGERCLARALSSLSCHANLWTDRGAGRLPEISLRRLTAKPPKFIYALIASHSPLSLSVTHTHAMQRSRVFASSPLTLLTVQVLSFAVLSREDATSRDGEADDSEIQDARYGAAALPSLTAAERVA